MLFRSSGKAAGADAVKVHRGNVPNAPARRLRKKEVNALPNHPKKRSMQRDSNQPPLQQLHKLQIQRARIQREQHKLQGRGTDHRKAFKDSEEQDRSRTELIACNSW